jgi:hypothetical protein
VEIHKPKPIRNWREFLKEYAIIVIGVLTALAAEQAVEWLHWQGEVKIARQAIAAEMTANNTNALAFRVATEPCINRQISEADAMLAALAAGREPNKLIIMRFTPGGLVRDSEWQSERASQVLTHFPHAELAMMSRYYAQIEEFRVWGDKESDAWQELSILQNPPAKMTTSNLIRLRVNLNIASRMSYLTILNAKRQLRVSKQLGIADPTPDPLRVKNYCTLNVEDYQRYRATQDLR